MAVERALFEVQGMWSATCARAIQHQLKRQPGVVDTTVSLVHETATVAWNPDATSVENLQASIDAIGCHMQPADAANPAATGVAVRHELEATKRRMRVAVALVAFLLVYQAALSSTPALLLAESASGVAGWAAFAVGLPMLLYAARRIHICGWRTARIGTPGIDTLFTVATCAAIAISVIELFSGDVRQTYLTVAAVLVLVLLIGRVVELRTRVSTSDALHEHASQMDASAASSTAATDTASEAQAASGGRFGRFTSAARAIADLFRSAPQDEAIRRDDAHRSAEQAGPVDAGSISGGACCALPETPARTNQLHAAADFWSVRFTVAVVVASLIAAALVLAHGGPAVDATTRALAVLIVTCPCALCLAVPLVFQSASRALRTHGCAIRDAQAVEDANRIDTVVFDKNGTLTIASLTLGEITAASGSGSERLNNRDALCLAAQLVHASDHPLSVALREAATAQNLVPGTFEGLVFESTTTNGVEGRATDGAVWRLARAQSQGPCDGPKATLVCNGVELATFSFSESLHPAAKTCVEDLQRQGLTVWLLSGDCAPAVARCAAELGIATHRTRADCDADDKVALVASLLNSGKRVVFVGGGANDVPGLAAATLGIAVYSSKAPSQEAAGMVMMRDTLDALPVAISILRKASGRARENLGLALLCSATALPIAVVGSITPAMALAGMAASSMLIAGNALRRNRGDEVHSRDAAVQPSH